MSDPLPPTNAPPIFPNMPDDADQYPVNPMVQNAIHSLFTLPQRAIQNSQNSLDTGNYDPGPTLEAATLPMGTGAIAGVPVRASEAVLGAGPVRKFLPSSKSLATPPAPTAADMTRAARIETVPLDQARGTQSTMNWDKFDGGNHPPALVDGYSDLPVAVKREDGEYLIFDGHHRAVKAINNGDANMQMHVIDAKDYAPQFAGRKPAPQKISDDDLLKALGVGEQPPIFARPASAALPMDEASRMARAAEQGYTIDAYKGGQPYDWATMPDKDWKGNVIAGTENRVPQELTSINSPNADYAGFFSHDPAVANRFAEPFEHGAVWPSKLKFDNPLVIDAEGKHAAAFQFDTIAQRNGTLDKMQAFKDAFKEGSPHDGVILRNTKDEGDVYVPRNPDQIRSRFAAFDPMNKGSGTLLGGLAGAAGAPIFAKQDK